MIIKTILLKLSYEQKFPGIPHSGSLTVYYISFEERQLAGNTTKFKVFLSLLPRCNTEVSKYAEG